MRAQEMEEKEEVVIERFRRLSQEKKEEVLDFLEFLESRDKVKAWFEFDEWAINLAKQKEFYQLTDDDIARIVSDFRSSKS
jgi:adenylate cyclase